MTTTRVGTPSNAKAALWEPVAFAGREFHLLKVDGSAWIAITPLCATLGISGATQERRLRRHAAASGLRLRTVRGRGTDDPWVAIELLELKWFLRTLRPANPFSRRTLAEWVDSLPDFLTDYWVRNFGAFQRQHAVRARSRIAQRRPTPPPPIRRGRGGITQAVIAEVRALHSSGATLREIAAAIGYSRTTVCQVLNGNYPSVASESDPEARLERPSTAN